MSTDQGDLEMSIGKIAETLDGALRKAFGGERGFAILVFKGQPGEAGEGFMLTNVEAEFLPKLLQDTVDTMEEPHDMPRAH